MLDANKKRSVVAVHFCADDAEAEVVVALLRDRGIDAFTNSQIAHNVLPIAAGKLGEVQILVDEANAERAIEVIDGAESDE